MVKYVPTLLNSISQNSTSETTVFILHSRLRQAHTEKLAELVFHNLTIRLIDVSENFTGMPIHLLPHTTKSTMDRLMLPSLLPGIKKIVYLDMDIIVNHDIKELYDMPTSEKGVLAKSSIMKGYTTVGDLIGNWAYDKNSLIEAIQGKVDLNATTFNAGVLVLDLEKLRKNNFEHIVLDLVQKFRLNDQLALVMYANGDYEKLPCYWNVFAHHEDVENPHIIHWAGPIKPWNFFHSVPYKSYWKKYRLRW